VYLYDSIEDLQKVTTRPDWVSACIIFYKERPPALFIPLEEGGGFWEKTAETPRPAHEITHMVVYEAIKLQDMGIIPRSVHEGIAQYESLKGGQNILYKFFIRLQLLLQRNELSEVDNISNLYNPENEREIKQFYNLSYIFVHHLASEYGDDKLWEVIKLVGDGKDFDNSFLEVYRMSYSESLLVFKESYFKF